VAAGALVVRVVEPEELVALEGGEVVPLRVHQVVPEVWVAVEGAQVQGQEGWAEMGLQYFIGLKAFDWRYLINEIRKNY
jgi:hypothetical protein